MMLDETFFLLYQNFLVRVNKHTNCKKKKKIRNGSRQEVGHASHNLKETSTPMPHSTTPIAILSAYLWLI